MYNGIAILSVFCGCGLGGVWYHIKEHSSTPFVTSRLQACACAMSISELWNEVKADGFTLQYLIYFTTDGLHYKVRVFQRLLDHAHRLKSACLCLEAAFEQYIPTPDLNCEFTDNECQKIYPWANTIVLKFAFEFQCGILQVRYSLSSIIIILLHTVI